ERPCGLAHGLSRAGGGRVAHAAAGGPAAAGRGAGNRGRGQPEASRRDPAQRQGPAPVPARGQGAAVFPGAGRGRGREGLPPEAQADAADSGRVRAGRPVGNNHTVTGGTRPPRKAGRREEQWRQGTIRVQGLRGTAGAEVTSQLFGSWLVTRTGGCTELGG